MSKKFIVGHYYSLKEGSFPLYICVKANSLTNSLINIETGEVVSNPNRNLFDSHGKLNTQTSKLDFGFDYDNIREGDLFSYVPTGDIHVYARVGYEESGNDGCLLINLSYGNRFCDGEAFGSSNKKDFEYICNLSDVAADIKNVVMNHAK